MFAGILQYSIVLLIKMYINEKEKPLIIEPSKIIESTMDMGMYASHGTFIRRLADGALKKFAKPKAAIINPFPSTQPRQKRKAIKTDNSIKLESKAYNAVFKFQSAVMTKKPVANQLIQPFLYIQKVLKKRTVDYINQRRGKQKCFVVPMKVKKTQFPQKVHLHIPNGYKNLYDFQQDRRNTANHLFDKMNQADVGDIKSIFQLWNGNSNNNRDLNIKQEQFLDFMNQLLPGKVSNKTLKHFFELYKNKDDGKAKRLQSIRPFEISIKLLAFNYEKFKKAENQVINILSQKSMKQRYTSLKIYNEDFNKNYQQLKTAMKQIKDYEQDLRRYFKRIFNSYHNPFQQQINHLKAQLQKPIIKYDKKKKEELTNRIQELENSNRQIQQRLNHEYQDFIDSYERTIVPNHDLFFTKRTANKLLLPLIQRYPRITRRMIQNRIGEQQNAKQRYLQCLSDLVVQMDNDKRMIGEDVFTLGQFTDMILLRGQGKNKRKQALTSDQPIQYIVKSSKKLVKEIKRQYLLKNQLAVDDLDDFPADEQIPIQILHRCFEMQCTKVLLKNQIWSQLINLIPTQTQQSKIHQIKIDANVCMQFLKKYFARLDSRISLQLRKSKQISLLAQKVSLQTFGTYGEVLNKVVRQIDQYVENADDEEPAEDNKEENLKRVTFADIVDQSNFKHNHPDQWQQKQVSQDRKNTLIKSMVKAIFEPEFAQKLQQKESQDSQIAGQHQQQIPQNLSLIKTLAKSSFFNEAVNTNAFDIRFYQKMQNENASKIYEPQVGQQVVRMGKSILLSNLPPVQDLPVSQADPLRISRFLLSNLDQGYKQARKIVKHKTVDHNIKEGVAHNYYRQKVKLQNKPTVYDCQGKSKYSVLLPVGYYEGMLEDMKGDEKWYLRPHHVQTLTQNPLSKKDNLIRTEYVSKMQKIPLKKRPEEFVIQQNVKRKEGIIQSLEERLEGLRNELTRQKTKPRNDQNGRGYIKAQQVDKYLLGITEGKQDKQLQLGAFEAILYDLRKKERQLVTGYRQQQKSRVGDPDKKWWERKDAGFNKELRKDRVLVSENVKGQDKHRSYVQKLKNDQLY